MGPTSCRATALVLLLQGVPLLRKHANFPRAVVGATEAMPPGPGYQGPQLVLGEARARLVLPYTRAPATIPH